MEGLLVSVIIPFRNAAPYLRDCLASVAAQTYSSLEVILVDDGSVDDGTAIVREIAQLDGRFRLIAGSGKGVSSARNIGLDYARGGWMAFVDADDTLPVNAIESLVNASGDADFVIGDFDLVRDGVVTHIRNIDCDERAFSTDDKMDLLALCMSNRGLNGSFQVGMIGPPWAKLYSREFLVRNHLRFNENLRLREDTIFNMNAIASATLVRYVPKTVYGYWVHPSSALHEGDPLTEEYVQDFLNELKALIEDNSWTDLRDLYYLECVRGIQLAWSKMGHSRKVLEKLCKEQPFADGVKHVDVHGLSKREALKIFLYKHGMYDVLCKALQQ